MALTLEHTLVAACVTLPLVAALLGCTRAGHQLGWLGGLAALPALALGVLLLPGSAAQFGAIWGASTPPGLDASAAAGAPAGFEWSLGWLLLGTRLGVDAGSGMMALLTGTLWLAASVAAHGYFDAGARRRIAPWWLLALAGNAALPVALDAVTYFTFFAIMSLASYALVVARGDAGARHAARTYMTYVIVGEVTLFCALVLTGHAASLAALLLLLGYGIKVGLLGLHAWLPLAHGAAPAPASAVLSAAMLKAGLLGWMRFFAPDGVLAPVAGEALVWLGLAAALVGVAVGLVQRSPKTILAYSSVSQMGLITTAFGLLLLAQPAAPVAAGSAALLGALALHHALAKGALFLGVAVVERSAGVARHLVLALLAVPALALAGLPATSGAQAKAALNALALAADVSSREAVLDVLKVAAAGTALLMARLFLALPRARSGAAGVLLWLPVVALVAVGLLLGLAGPQPLRLADAAQVGAVVLTALLLALTWRRLGPDLTLEDGAGRARGAAVLTVLASLPGIAMARIAERGASALTPLARIASSGRAFGSVLEAGLGRPTGAVGASVSAVLVLALALWW